MLSRRNVRVKMMQVLYAQNRDEGLDQKSTVKEYWKKIDDSFDLLLFSVYNLISITKTATDDYEKRKSKHLPSDLDKIFTPKLWSTSMIQALVKNKNLQQKFENKNFAQRVDKDHFRVGGGSLGYANVLEVPTDETFATPSWNKNLKWSDVLRPHYETAKKMLGVARNRKLWRGDEVLKQIAEERGMGHTFRASDVGAFFGESAVTVADPFFGGEGPARAGCRHCGGGMVGCRYNAKNTLPKNYLSFAEKNGAEVRAEVEVTDVRPLTIDGGQQSAVNGQRSAVKDVNYAI